MPVGIVIMNGIGVGPLVMVGRISGLDYRTFLRRRSAYICTKARF